MFKSGTGRPRGSHELPAESRRDPEARHQRAGGRRAAGSVRARARPGVRRHRSRSHVSHRAAAADGREQPARAARPDGVRVGAARADGRARARRRVHEPGEPAPRPRRRPPQGDRRAAGARLRPLADRAAALRRGAHALDDRRGGGRGDRRVGDAPAVGVADARAAVPRGRGSHARRPRAAGGGRLRRLQHDRVRARPRVGAGARAAHAGPQGRRRTQEPARERTDPRRRADRRVARARHRRRPVRARRDEGLWRRSSASRSTISSSSGSTRASPATARRARARSTATCSSACGRCRASPARASPRPCPSATSRKAGRCRSDPRPPSRRTSPWSAPTSSARSGCTCCGAASSRGRKNRAADARPRRPSSPSRWRASCSATPTPSAVRSRCRSTRAWR